MKRLTVDKPAGEMNMVELAYNCMYAKDGWRGIEILSRIWT